MMVEKRRTATSTTTTTSTHAGTVGELYAAFGRGDVPFILDHLTEEVSWEHGLRSNELPWMQPRTGKEQVGEFFSVLAQGFAISTFEPQFVTGEGDTVVALIRLAGSIVSTGKPVEEDLWAHVWKFDTTGKVASFRHIGDLAREEIPFKA